MNSESFTEYLIALTLNSEKTFPSAPHTDAALPQALFFPLVPCLQDTSLEGFIHTGYNQSVSKENL